MGRYVERSGGTTYTWKYRTPVTVDDETGTPGGTDVTITVPVDMDLFWDNVRSAGEDVRIVAADGETAVATWEFDPAFSTSTRACTIVADAATAGSSGVSILWLYWGQATVTTAAGSFVAAATHTGIAIVSSYAVDVVFVWSREAPNVNKARPAFQKTANETVVVAIAYRGILARRAFPYGGGIEDEEPSTIDYAVYDDTSAQAAMVETGSTRLDENYIYLIVKAGTTGTEYTLRVTMTTTSKSNTGLARTLEFSATVRVKNPTEG